MDLRSLARWVRDSHFSSEFKAQGCCILPGHSDGDSERSLRLSQNGERLFVSCYGGLGHTTDQLLTVWGLSRADLVVSRPAPQESPAFEQKPAEEAFSGNGTEHRPKVPPRYAY